MSEEFIARLREKCPYCEPCSADKRKAADLIEGLQRRDDLPVRWETCPSCGQRLKTAGSERPAHIETCARVGARGSTANTRSEGQS